MLKFAFLIILLLGGPAMAIPLETPDYDPMKQRITPEGQTLPRDAPPTRTEMFLLMWKQSAGDRPIPENLRQKYGLPPETPPQR